MDRNVIKEPVVTAEDLIPLLSSQIGQLNSELIASKLMIQKLKELIDDLTHTVHNGSDVISS